MDIRFLVSGCLADPPIRNGYDLLVRLDCDFAVTVNDRTVFVENLVAVELAYQLQRWIDSGFPAGQAFEFNPSDDDRSGLVWIRPVDREWAIGSSEGLEPFGTRLNGEMIENLVRTFQHDVAQIVSRTGGVDIRPILSGEQSLTDPVIWSQ